MEITEKTVPLLYEISRRVADDDWAIVGLASCGVLPVGLLAWVHEEFGIAAHDLILAVIIDKRERIVPPAA